jgi:nucleoside-diphosphate-sugar epimerase
MAEAASSSSAPAADIPRRISMHVFVTGASGWIGSAVVADLIEAGHQVSGLARSDAAAEKVAAAGAQVVRGSIDDHDVITEAAAAADGVVHLAFKHDLAFTGQMDVAADDDRALLLAIADTLAGTDKPLLFASGVAGLRPGHVLTEGDRPDAETAATGRIVTEARALAYAERGVRVASVRFAPTVHGAGGDHGFIATIAAVAREQGTSGYVGDGAARWCAVNRLDAAHLITLGVEGVPAGTILHATAEEGISTKAIAEAIAAQQGIEAVSVPADQAADHFGWIGMFWGIDMPASSVMTQALLNWTPTHPGLIDDIAAGHYPG